MDLVVFVLLFSNVINIIQAELRLFGFLFISPLLFLGFTCWEERQKLFFFVETSEKHCFWKQKSYHKGHPNFALHCSNWIAVPLNHFRRITICDFYTQNGYQLKLRHRVTNARWQLSGRFVCSDELSFYIWEEQELKHRHYIPRIHSMACRDDFCLVCTNEKFYIIYEEVAFSWSCPLDTKCVDWSTVIVSGGDKIYVWDTSFLLETHDYPCDKLCVSPCGQYVVFHKDDEQHMTLLHRTTRSTLRLELPHVPSTLSLVSQQSDYVRKHVG